MIFRPFRRQRFQRNISLNGQNYLYTVIRIYVKLASAMRENHLPYPAPQAPCNYHEEAINEQCIQLFNSQ